MSDPSSSATRPTWATQGQRPVSLQGPLPSSFAPPRMKEYVLTERLGSGSYATVYKGYKKGNTRDIVAVKCVVRRSLGKSSAENLLREIEILKSLDHEHIVKFKDFHWDQSNVFLVLEYCSGGDLSTYIQQYKRLSENVARRFLRQLALALRYIRQRNISHMDLKPQNLLLLSKEDLTLKVADFGFAQYILDEDERRSLRGSPLYMAVEMFLTDTYDASVDLWSTGVILHETLFGYAPFASPTYEELHMKILSTDPVIVPSYPQISSACRDLLVRLLQRDPKQRISFEEFFKHPFVDLEHAPSPETINKAIKIVTEAIKFDSEGDARKAVDRYCSAVEYFIPAIEFEKSLEKKSALRTRVKQYIDRAELLKFQISHGQKKTWKNEITLTECTARLPGLEKAMEHADMAEKLDSERKYGEAMEEYRKACELCMSILSSTEKRGRTYDLIRGRVEELLNRMEELSRYKEVFAQEDYSIRACCIQ